MKLITPISIQEATSALDSLTEQEIQQALTESPCTRLIVAHRLSTIKDADRIVVMKVRISTLSSTDLNRCSLGVQQAVALNNASGVLFH